MPEAGYLWEVIVLLAAAVVAVAFAYHLRLGPIMGYLVAGIAIGPHGLGLIQDLESTRALAELGVVFLLFTIGLELPLSRTLLAGDFDELPSDDEIFAEIDGLMAQAEALRPASAQGPVAAAPPRAGLRRQRGPPARRPPHPAPGPR